MIKGVSHLDISTLLRCNQMDGVLIKLYFTHESDLQRAPLLVDGAQCEEKKKLQMAPALNNVLFGVRLDAYWLPQPSTSSCGHVLPTRHLVMKTGF